MNPLLIFLVSVVASALIVSDWRRQRAQLRRWQQMEATLRDADAALNRLRGVQERLSELAPAPDVKES